MRNDNIGSKMPDFIKITHFKNNLAPVFNRIEMSDIVIYIGQFIMINLNMLCSTNNLLF